MTPCKPTARMETEEEGALCKICMGAPATHACVHANDTAHKCYCAECADRARQTRPEYETFIEGERTPIVHMSEQCPICRRRSISIIQVFEN